MMNRQDFLKNVLIGAGLSPILLNAKIKKDEKKKAQYQKEKYTRYGGYISYEEHGSEEEVKEILIRNMNDTLRGLKIKKKDIVSIKFMEKSRKINETGDPFRTCCILGWIAKVRRKKG